MRKWIVWLLLLPLPAFCQTAENVRLLCSWTDTPNIRFNQQGARYSGCWGWAAPGGQEYGFIGSTEGVHVIDVNNCAQVAFAPGRAAGEFVLRREYRTYGHYLYAICDEGTSSLQVFDLRYLPDSLHLVWESNPADFSRAHDLAIDTARAKLYLASAYGPASGDDYMRVYSLSNPESPQQLLRFNTYEKVHTVFVRNDTAYTSMGFYGLSVLNFASAPAWSPLGFLLSYPDKGYNHSCWLNAARTGAMTDETFGSPVKIIDATAANNIRVRSSWSPRPGENTCVAHNPYVRGNYAFIAYYLDGLQILDISNPLAPRRTGYYDSYSGADFQGYAGVWGAYPFLPSGKVLFSDMQTGLYVVDASQATGVSEKVSSSLQVWPNPAKERISLRLPQSGQAFDWQLLDAAGQCIRSGRLEASGSNAELVIPLAAEWPAGLYCLRLRGATANLTTRFTKL